MKNKLCNVSDILIEQLERLNDEEVCSSKENTEAETKKAEAMVKISNAIVGIGMTQLRAMEVAEKCGYTKQELPNLLLDA